MVECDDLMASIFAGKKSSGQQGTIHGLYELSRVV